MNRLAYCPSCTSWCSRRAWEVERPLSLSHTPSPTGACFPSFLSFIPFSSLCLELSLLLCIVVLFLFVNRVCGGDLCMCCLCVYAACLSCPPLPPFVLCGCHLIAMVPSFFCSPRLVIRVSFSFMCELTQCVRKHESLAEGVMCIFRVPAWERKQPLSDPCPLLLPCWRACARRHLRAPGEC